MHVYLYVYVCMHADVDVDVHCSFWLNTVSYSKHRCWQLPPPVGLGIEFVTRWARFGACSCHTLRIDGGPGVWNSAHFRHASEAWDTSSTEVWCSTTRRGTGLKRSVFRKLRSKRTEIRSTCYSFLPKSAVQGWSLFCVCVLVCH